MVSRRQLPKESSWDTGKVFHLLPTVNHDRALLKCSFVEALPQAPRVRCNNRTFIGRKTDSRGLFWQFDIQGLKPGTEFKLELQTANGKSLAEPWTLSTFPDPESSTEHVRIGFYTCAGGHDVLSTTAGFFQSMATRQALISKLVSLKPHAIVANGDQVYWDLHAPNVSEVLGASKTAIAYAGQFDASKPIFGTSNESFLLKSAAEQISPLYRTICRSIPVFFVQDDHDYYDNDDASDKMVPFPPSYHMLRLARATQKILYPEFLPDRYRPQGLPGNLEDEGRAALSSNFGTLRYGSLLEVLLYDARRTGTLHGPSAVLVDETVESWLKDRMRSRDVTHVVNAPGLPPGWTKGNYWEWYPDLIRDGKATVARPKDYWQSGWLAQHDRIVQASSEMAGRVPLIISGDIHATAIGRMIRSGKIDMSKNPVVTVLPGTIGSKGRGFASRTRLPNHLDMIETMKPVLQNGFTIADFYKDRIDLDFYLWDGTSQSATSIGGLAPAERVTLRPIT